MMNANNSCLPVEVRTAVYRRALAQGYLNACKTLVSPYRQRSTNYR